MPAPLIRYVLDPTGTNPDNFVSGEVKTLSTAAVRAIAPAYGPFFSESVVIYDHGNSRLLARGTDYQIVDLLQTATLKFGKEISQVVLILNPAVGSQVRLNYQVLGGYFQSNAEGLISLYEAAIADNRPINWVNVLNRPTEYPPALHTHLLQDVYGFESVVAELERIKNAIVLSNVPAFEELINWVQRNISSNNNGGPGNVSKESIGLGNVDNTADTAKPVSIAQQTAITLAQTSAQTNAIAASAPIAHVGSIGTAHGTATTVSDGFMSAADKVILVSLQTQLNTLSAALSELLSVPAFTAPTITSPANLAVDLQPTLTIQSNAPANLSDGSIHQSSDWQIATDAGFTTIVSSVTSDVVNKVSWSPSGLTYSSAYFVRVRYRSSNGKIGAWSNVISFTVMDAFTANVTIATAVNNYNMRSAAIASGWNGVMPLKLTVTVNSGIVIGSTDTTSYAFDTDGTFPLGSTLSLINNGTIVGKGGDGGVGETFITGAGWVAAGAGGSGGGALLAQAALSVTNNGTIGGGGGGGGGGINALVDGGGGGGGQGFTNSAGGIYGSAATLITAATAGTGGTVTSPGIGGNASGIFAGGGGTLGQPGADGDAPLPHSTYVGVGPGAGGSAGAAVTGNSLVTWNAIGTRLGPLV